eukprot:419920-Amphidinium_carterae.1
MKALPVVTSCCRTNRAQLTTLTMTSGMSECRQDRGSQSYEFNDDATQALECDFPGAPPPERNSGEGKKGNAKGKKVLRDASPEAMALPAALGWKGEPWQPSPGAYDEAPHDENEAERSCRQP